jgi:hypothetical protein
MASASKWVVLYSVRADEAYLIAEDAWDGVTFPAGEKVSGRMPAAYQEAVRRHAHTAHEGQLIRFICFE